MATIKSQLRRPGSLANLVRVFRMVYPDVPRAQAEPRILKRWLTYIANVEHDPKQEARILSEYLDMVF